MNVSGGYDNGHWKLDDKGYWWWKDDYDEYHRGAWFRGKEYKIDGSLVDPRELSEEAARYYDYCEGVPVDFVLNKGDSKDNGKRDPTSTSKEPLNPYYPM